MQHRIYNERYLRNDQGFSIPELVIVLLVGSILLVIALPSLLSSRRLVSLGSLPYEISSTMREARQAGISQRKRITVEYDDANKKIIIYGGSYGAPGSWKNKIVWITGGGLGNGDVRFGSAPGVTNTTLSDGTSNSGLTAGKVRFAFEGDGSVRDVNDNPIDTALFFYHRVYGKQGAFAISVLGVTGRVKIWRFSTEKNGYVE